MGRDFRGDDTCIFNDTRKAHDFCSWNKSMMTRLQTEDPLDRLDVCRLCQEQSTLRSVSFIGTLLKELKDSVIKLLNR